ncbi:MAG: hypothetical protein IPK44_02000 [Candidatus Accumulibacter sp.]|uniref:hypothetical protein n=1 Tax=Accumulibacter sp. TaxID=2053492 RepID=UPI00259079FF|nr:hypothetical protein [Accumulibacter sp.]MBK8113374.1 hypothetical protein [Accumulibacter sp.]
MHESLELLLVLTRKAEEGKIDGYALDIPFFLSRWLFPQSASRARAHFREQETLGILERNYLLSAISEWTGIAQRVIHDHIYNHRRDLKGN